MKKSILIILSALLCFSACLKDELREDKVQINIRAISELSDLKSSIPAKELAITDMNVYAYSGGKLYAEAYSSGSSLKLLLDKAKQYNLYVLANVGKQDAPWKEGDLADVGCTFVYQAEGYLPMASRVPTAFNPASGRQDMTVSLSRLVSKYSLSLERNLQNCTLTLNSVRILQEADKVYPFQFESKAESVCDGDCSTEADILSINSDQSIVFYVMENCQGVLLPTNEDPYEKNPSSIGNKAELCTYMELEGTWSTNGAQAVMLIRLYLGEDNCKDFNVRGNTDVRITLGISDSGTLKSEWKAERQNIEDNRVLTFLYQDSYIYQEDGWTQIPMRVNPSDLEYKIELLSCEMEDAVEFKVENGLVYARALYDGIQTPKTEIRVSTWDGALSSTTKVNLSFRKTPFENYEAELPSCVGEYGYVRFDDSGLEYPIVISTLGSCWTVGDPSLQGMQVYQDPLSLDYYYYSPEEKILYIYRSGVSANSEVTVDCGKTTRSFLLEAATYPQIKLNDGFVSEAGCFKQDEKGRYYDSGFVAYLADSQGNKIPMKRFATPAAILDYQGKAQTLANSYANFESVFGRPSPESSSTASNISFLPQIYSAAQMYAYYEESGNLWKFLAVGVDDLPEESYQVYLKLPTASIQGEAELSCLKAFPSQRQLGEFYNYQIAPGNLRSNTLSIDFTEGGAYLFPPSQMVQWTVKQSTEDLSSEPSAAYASAFDSKYSSGVSISGNTMSFKDMSTDIYPSCGHLAMQASVANPYSHKVYYGYYTMDLILYMSVGCQFDYLQPTSSTIGSIGISFVPFCEFSTKANSALWADMLPKFLMAKIIGSTKSYAIKVPASSSANSFTITGEDYIPRGTFPLAMAKLGAHKSEFEFDFYAFFNSGTELHCNREGFEKLYPAPEMKAYKDGRKGYYHLVRQFDLANMPTVTSANGLENHLIEAAYGSLSY